MQTIETKTAPWELEPNLKITTDHDGTTIVVGGFSQPEYTITAPNLPEAIAKLVKAVTRDAIEDEAREWTGNFSA